VAGVGLIAGSLYLNSTIAADISDISELDDAAQYGQKRDEIRSNQSVGQVLLYSGIGLAALGGSAIVWDLVSPGESPFSVSLNPTQNGMGFSVMGEF